MDFCHVGQDGLELPTSETGFRHVAQAGLELLSSSKPSTSAADMRKRQSQSIQIDLEPDESRHLYSEICIASLAPV
ncbi:hypothetical protein AAY473_028291 [Plecturocebus cupreus]